MTMTILYFTSQPHWHFVLSKMLIETSFIEKKKTFSVLHTATVFHLYRRIRYCKQQGWKYYEVAFTIFLKSFLNSWHHTKSMNIINGEFFVDFPMFLQKLRTTLRRFPISPTDNFSFLTDVWGTGAGSFELINLSLMNIYFI